MNFGENDWRIARFESRKGGWIHRLVRHLTKWAWKSQLRAPINRMYERGLIDSYTFHEATEFANRLTR